MSFATILRAAVEAVPNSIGGSFAAWDGEMVESFARRDAYEWAVLTAHYGVVLANLYAAFGTLHFGSPEMFLVRNGTLDVVVHAVDEEYYALIAMDRPAPQDPETEPFSDALATIANAAFALRKEIGV